MTIELPVGWWPFLMRCYCWNSPRLGTVGEAWEVRWTRPLKVWIALCGGCWLPPICYWELRELWGWERPWEKQTCERSVVTGQLLTYWAPRLQSKKTQKKLSKFTYRFYTAYIQINILHYLNHWVLGDTIIQSKTKYSWIAMWHLKPCLRHHQSFHLKLPSSQSPNYKLLKF